MLTCNRVDRRPFEKGKNNSKIDFLWRAALRNNAPIIGFPLGTGGGGAGEAAL